jgi:two-component system sensor histidine kinase PilS (NtrC family)
MSRSFPLEKVIIQSWNRTAPGFGKILPEADDLGQRLLWIIGIRTVILFLGINLARPLGILPERFGVWPFIPAFNILSVILAFGCLAIWWSGRRPLHQLYLQIGIDLAITTALVAQTHATESPFLSFYLLIIIYCSLLLGRNGGMIGATLSIILYAGVIALTYLGIFTASSPVPGLNALTFRISFHALGFISVALLGSDLSHRLHRVQKELEQKIDSLEELQRLTKHIVSSIRSGLFTTDLNGNVTLFNSTAEELTEKNRSRVLGHSIRQVIGDGLWNKIQDADLFRDARPLRHEEWIAIPGSSRRFLGFSVSPLLDQEKQLIGYIVSFQDLTEIKKLEEEIRIRDRMAAIGRMAAGIAHEIRNPLAAMRGSVEILSSHLKLQGNDGRLLDILIRESDRLNKFVEDFLVFAKPAPCTRKPIDLAPMLRDSVTLLKNSPDVREKHTVDLRLAEDPIRILGDPDKLRQVFWNLAQNALRAMPSGGVLVIAANPAPDGGVEILFEDNGAGMSEEEKNQLFQPFHSKFAGGTGLGLSIIFQIMEDHNGKIHFDSEKGRGTKVTLRFPPAIQ